MVAEAAYSKSGWITETKTCLLAVGVNCLHVRRKAPILRPTFLQIESTWGDQERLSSMIIPRRRVCETSLTFSFCSKSRTPVVLGDLGMLGSVGRWPWQPFWKHWSRDVDRLSQFIVQPTRFSTDGCSRSVIALFACNWHDLVLNTELFLSEVSDPISDHYCVTVHLKVLRHIRSDPKQKYVHPDFAKTDWLGLRTAL